MPRRRVWLGLGLAFVVLVTSAGVGWAGWGEDLRYRHALVKPGERGQQNRYVDLDDGEAQFSIGSPDGHRILVQTRLLGEETWSEPEVLDGAPAGYRCTWLEGYEVGEEGYAVLMTCHSGKLPAELRDKPYYDFRGDAYVVAVTPDLRHWESTFVTGVRQEPQVDDDQVRVGDTTWTPEDGFVTR